MVKNKRQKTSVGKDKESLQFSYIADECVIWYRHLENWQHLQKINICIPYDYASMHLNVHPTERNTFVTTKT